MNRSDFHKLMTAVVITVSPPVFAQGSDQPAPDAAMTAEKAEEMASAAILSADFEPPAVDVAYEDDPRVPYVGRLVAALDGLPADKRADVDPLVVTEKTFLSAGGVDVFNAREALAGGLLVVVDKDGNTATTNDAGELVGRVSAPFEAIGRSLKRAKRDGETDRLAWILDNVTPAPANLNDYAALTGRIVGPLADWPELAGLFSPTTIGHKPQNEEWLLGSAPGWRSAKTAPVLTEADIFAALGGEVAGEPVVYIEADDDPAGVAVGGEADGWPVFTSRGLGERARRGLFSRVGVETVPVPVDLDRAIRAGNAAQQIEEAKR